MEYYSVIIRNELITHTTLLNYLFFIIFDCAGSSLLHTFSLVAGCRLLSVVASLVVEHRP